MPYGVSGPATRKAPRVLVRTYPLAAGTLIDDWGLDCDAIGSTAIELFRTIRLDAALPPASGRVS